MKVRSIWMVLAALVWSLSPLASIQSPVMAQEEAPAAEAPASQDDLMTEAQLAEVLVNVLGLAPMLPPNPKAADMFAILLQNGISPKDGWNPDNNVTLGNLARIMVQSMGDADKIENPEDDASWVEYLKSVGVEFGTIEEAIDRTEPLADPVALEAIETSTDPLRKESYIRPTDDQQLGADLQPYRRLISKSDLERLFPQPEPPQPPPPPPVTPN